jgi:hypothetical protein
MNIVKKQELVNSLIELTEEMTRCKVALGSIKFDIVMPNPGGEQQLSDIITDLEIKQVKIKNKLLND